MKCCSIVHQDVIDRVKEQMPQERILYDLAELFKVFGDTTRVRIVSALFHEKMCVCDIACLLGMTHSAISHQLRILKQSRLVRSEKVGKVVYYSLDDEHIRELFHIGIEHISH